MDTLPTLINALVAALATTTVWFITRAQSQALERRLDRFEDKADARFDPLETKLEGKIDAVRADITQQIDGVRTDLSQKIDAVRADLTHLAFRLGEAPRPQTG